MLSYLMSFPEVQRRSGALVSTVRSWDSSVEEKSREAALS